MLRNAVALVGLLAVSTIYLWIGAPYLPDSYALIVNFVLVPGSIGSAAGYLFVGRLVAKLVLLVAIPVVHVLVFGGDPAKPGLENLLGALELVPLFVGCTLVHLLHVSRKPKAAQGPV
jgi:hypothetical protein